MPILLTKENEKCAQTAILPVSIAEADSMHRIKPVTLLNHMQELAATSIEKYDIRYGWSELLKQGYAWFLIRYRIEFESIPKDVNQIRIATESRGCNRMNAYRDFEVYDNISNERILRATSAWFIVDINNKSVVNIQKEFPEFFKFQSREDDLQLQKLKTIDKIDSQKTFHVRYDDLDINNHVNNTVYVQWALEALDYDFRISNDLKALDIYFKHEVKYGEDVLSLVKYDYDNNTTEHVIKNANTGEELCLLKAEFIKR